MVLCLFFLYGIISYAKAQNNNLSFYALTLENGLSQRSVTAITQDKQGYIWLGTRQGLNRYDGHRFKVYFSGSDAKNTIAANEIACLLTDSNGVLWVGTTNGLNRYDELTDSFIKIEALGNLVIQNIYQDSEKRLWISTQHGLYFAAAKEKLIFKKLDIVKSPRTLSNFINCVFDDGKGSIWVGTINGLFVLNKKNGTYTAKKIIDLHPDLRSGNIMSFCLDRFSNLWIGTTSGLFLVDSAWHVRFFTSKNPNTLVNNDIRQLLPNEDGQIWIATQDGLSILDPKTLVFTNYKHDLGLGNSISNSSILNMFKDRNKNVWLGTYYGGVNIVYPVATSFKVYQNSKVPTSISGNIISSILEDKKGNLWIGTEGGGINYFNRANNTFKSYNTILSDTTSISSNLVKVMIKEDEQSDNLIVGTHRGWINLFNPNNGKFTRIKNAKNRQGEIGSAEIVALLRDRNGTIWIGSKNGLSTLTKMNGVYPKVTRRSFLNKYIYNEGVASLMQDSNGNIWIGTFKNIYLYNPNKKEIHYLGKSNLHKSFITDGVNCVVESKTKEILIGTSASGLKIYNPQTRKVKTYTTGQGLANNTVWGVLEDNQQNYWITTANGLSALNTTTQKIRNYTKSDGLADNEFNAHAYFEDSKGEFFVGGTSGLNAFYPSKIQVNKQTSPLVFTGLSLFNHTIGINGPDKLLSAPINATKKLTFKHEQSHFAIDFALLNYIKSDKNKYAYQLKKYDKDWIYTNNPTATYTNIPAGSYTFVAKGINNDGVFSDKEATIKIVIEPALWATWWAYCSYFLLFSGVLFLIIRYLIIRALLKQTNNIQQMKLRFFTHVSHEIRTPLTLIVGPLENLLAKTNDLPHINKQVVQIKNNADRLLRLTTELLDFRKTETGHLKLHLAELDIVHFMHEIYNAFKHLSEGRRIEFELEYDNSPLLLWFDKSQMEKVFFNLISNAFKFTKDGGAISIKIIDDKHHVKILVRDNGMGISEENKDKLFSDFFQVNSSDATHIGSGIGLALSKSIAMAHAGDIAIESNEETTKKSGFTCFTVTLNKGDGWISKLGKNVSFDQEIAADFTYTPDLSFPLDTFLETEDSTKHREVILIVDDNVEIRQMIKTIINEQYDILESENGQIGWETAIEQVPDLIICDVMMPVLNGLELCKKLKTDERTSHIPVIMLTARSSQVHQIEGLQTGADSYITKPFSTALLLLNIRNLLQYKENIRKKYSQKSMFDDMQVVPSNIDELFLNKVIASIEAKMSDQEFGVIELSKEVNMSPPVLYKKIRAITNLSVNDFVKTIRLEKASQLLKTKGYNISEVSFLVGFNDTKYFSREFKKRFGDTPKVYLEKLNDGMS